MRAKYDVTVGGSIGVSGVGKLLASAEVKVDANLVAFGSYNKATRVKVVTTMRNPTSHNRKFVVFKATRQYRGRFVELHCEQQPAQQYGHWVKKSSGKWRSHKSFASGNIRCGAGNPDGLAKYVAGRHC